MVNYIMTILNCRSALLVKEQNSRYLVHGQLDVSSVGEMCVPNAAQR